MHTVEANNLLRLYIIPNRYTFLSAAKNLVAMIRDILRAVPSFEAFVS